MQPFLSRPSVEYKASYIAASLEFLAEGRKPGWKIEMLEQHFDEYVETLLSKETDPPAGYVPQSEFWLIVAGQFAGRCSVRHTLNPSLMHFGGHIGYEIRPSMRRRGYGLLQCQLAIEKARELGIERILITCDDDNIGSCKIIEANGGILENKVDTGRDCLTRRYWIEK